MALLLGAPVHADKTATAQQVIAQAEAAFVAKDYATALKLYTQARAKKDAPLLVYMTARCLEQLERFEEAVATYEAYLELGSKEEGPRGRATTAIRLLNARLATGTLVIRVSPSGAEVSLDGRLLGKAPVPTQRLKPGSYAVKVVLGDKVDESRVVVRGGRTVDHVVSLQVAKPEPVKGVEESSSVEPFVVLGSGIAVGLAGAALITVGELDLQDIADGAGTSPGAPGSLTQREAAEQIDSATTLRMVGFVLAGVGVAAAIGGAVWLATASDGPETQGTVIESAGPALFQRGAGVHMQGRF